MRDSIQQWRNDGVEVALIGNGDTHEAASFRDEFELEGPLFIAPERGAYRAAGLRRNAAGIANPRIVTNAARPPRNRSFANAYPASALCATDSAVTVIATMRLLT